MASQSSAVLDMNDCDDTDAPSVSEDAEVPLIMEPPYDIAVKVDCPMKQLSTLETYVTYRVRCVCARWPTPRHVRRRYNQFKELHRRLVSTHPWAAVPALPALHSAAQQLDRYAPAFVNNRSHSLHALLDQIAKHPILTHSEDFRIFLTTPDEEMDKIFRNENSALNLWGLGSVLYGHSDSKSANGSRVKDPEFTAASDYLTSLQHKLATLCTLTNKLYKGTNQLGHEMAGMKRACDAWSSHPPASPALSSLSPALSSLSSLYCNARLSSSARAQLPLCASTAQAHVKLLDKRAALHAEYIAGNSSSSELHNRLEQATESIRAELSHWLPRTRSELRTILLDLADRQVNLYAQTYSEWERALKLSSAVNAEDLFKTVSKTAVQNMSPSRSRSDIEIQNTVESDSVVTQLSDSVDSDAVNEISDVNCEQKVSDPLQSFTDVDLAS